MASWRTNSGSKAILDSVEDGTSCSKTLPPAIPLCTWPRFHAHLGNPELWCPAGCRKELRARRQGCLEWRVGSRHVACGEDRRAVRMRASGVSLPIRGEECRWGLHTGNTSAVADPVRSGERALCAAVHGGEKINGGVVASRSAADFVAPGKSRDEPRGSRWTETLRAPRRAEYVKSKGRANVRRGRKTSGVAGEAKLREKGRLDSKPTLFAKGKERERFSCHRHVTTIYCTGVSVDVVSSHFWCAQEIAINSAQTGRLKNRCGQIKIEWITGSSKFPRGVEYRTYCHE
ncbi:hypothetical protein BJY52DRAFT_1413645 [Lactarius psammicola]|nr:hypothetical protein BJY52DRAFT_1413645 [Lactarius psammicola]